MKTIKLRICTVQGCEICGEHHILDEIRCDVKNFFIQNNHIGFTHCDDENDEVDLPDLQYVSLNMEENEVEIVRLALPDEFDIDDEDMHENYDTID